MIEQFDGPLQGMTKTFYNTLLDLNDALATINSIKNYLDNNSCPYDEQHLNYGRPHCAYCEIKDLL